MGIAVVIFLALLVIGAQQESKALPSGEPRLPMRRARPIEVKIEPVSPYVKVANDFTRQLQELNKNEEQLLSQSDDPEYQTMVKDIHEHLRAELKHRFIEPHD